MNKKLLKVYVDASVIFAALLSPIGGSAKLLHLIKSKHIHGFASILVMEEVIRHTDIVKKSRQEIEEFFYITFTEIALPPSEVTVSAYMEQMIDVGDAHLFASCQELACDILVSLDKKHVLSMKEIFPSFSIMNPGEIIRFVNTLSQL